MAEEQKQAAAATTTTTEASLLDEILGETKLSPTDDGYEVAKRGVQAFLSELLTPQRSAEKVDKALADAHLAAIDEIQ